METHKRQKWYTEFETNKGNEIFFAPTLADLKQQVLAWLIKKCPTRIVVLEGSKPTSITYEKIGHGVWRPSLLTNDEAEFFEEVSKRMFIGPSPEYAEELVNKKEGNIYEELIDIDV